MIVKRLLLPIALLLAVGMFAVLYSTGGSRSVAAMPAATVAPNTGGQPVLLNDDDDDDDGRRWYRRDHREHRRRPYYFPRRYYYERPRYYYRYEEPRYYRYDGPYYYYRRPYYYDQRDRGYFRLDIPYFDFRLDLGDDIGGDFEYEFNDGEIEYDDDEFEFENAAFEQVQDSPQPPSDRPDRQYGYLGIMFRNVPPALAEHLELENGEGVLVVAVAGDSPAGSAGIKRGDVITQVGDQTVFSGMQFARLIGNQKPGTKVRIQFIHKGQRDTKEVTIGDAGQQRWRGPLSRGPGRLGQGTPGGPQCSGELLLKALEPLKTEVSPRVWRQINEIITKQCPARPAPGRQPGHSIPDGTRSEPTRYEPFSLESAAANAAVLLNDDDDDDGDDGDDGDWDDGEDDDDYSDQPQRGWDDEDWGGDDGWQGDSEGDFLLVNSAGGGGQHGYMGVNVVRVPPQMADHLNLPQGTGVVVASVANNSPAAKAGIERGDVIIRVDTQTIYSVAQFTKLISSREPNQQIRLEIVQDGKKQTKQVTLGQTSRQVWRGPGSMWDRNQMRLHRQRMRQHRGQMTQPSAGCSPDRLLRALEPIKDEVSPRVWQQLSQTVRSCPTARPGGPREGSDRPAALRR